MIEKDVLTEDQWEEFLARLEGSEGCDFRQKIPGDVKSITWKCSNGRSRPFAEKILKEMGISVAKIADVMTFCDEHGGYCDCEIVFNVAGAVEGGS